jgi:NADH:ubiquinone oxidoreductase subunit K
LLFGLSEAQLIAIVLFCIGLLGIVYIDRRHRRLPGVPS